MPKINAQTVAEHVAQQEAAVFAAAVRLFTERGYDAVSLRDIAAEVGLARNSLYRYFPSKGDILVRWVTRELDAEVARSERLLSGQEPPTERIRRWALAQLDYASTPEHALIVNIASHLPELDEDARVGLADIHRRLREPLEMALRAAGIGRKADRGAVADLLGGLVNATAQHESGAHDGRARVHLLKAIDALIA